VTVLGAERSPQAADELHGLARAVLERAGEQCVRIACAESCTGGLLASLLTDVEGCSGAFERGFVTYSDEAKAEMLGVDPVFIATRGAVSAAVAVAMASGALINSRADIAVSITGYAGAPEPGGEEGEVHLALVWPRGPDLQRECHFGQRGRDENRLLAARAALEMLEEALDQSVRPNA
jgi:nicotinamide-nucleotide amidase